MNPCSCHEKIKQINDLINEVSKQTKAAATGRKTNPAREIRLTRDVLKMTLGRNPTEGEVVLARSESWPKVEVLGLIKKGLFAPNFKFDNLTC